MQRILRITVGPSMGSVVVLGSRTSIGRAAEADVQLLDPFVSRMPARIVVSPMGGVELIDLGSDNGTFVDGARVRRAVQMRSGQELRIGEHELVYEETTADAPHLVSSPIFHAKVRAPLGESETRRLPAVGWTDETLRSAGSAASETGDGRRIEGGWEPARWIAETLAEEGLLGAGAGGMFSAIKPEPQHPTSLPQLSSEVIHGDDFSLEISVAAESEASAPRGGLGVLLEVLEFRQLRLRALRGSKIDAIDRARLRQLETKHQRQLGRGRLASLRKFQRFSCILKAQYSRTQNGLFVAVPAKVEDLGAGGALVTMDPAAVRPGELAYLAVDLGEGNPQSVVIETRVVWMRPEDAKVGMAWAGPIRYRAAMASVSGRTG